MKLLIVANNSEWKTWPKRTKEIREYFRSKVDLNIEVVHTQFADIPFEAYSEGTGEGMGVGREWYDRNVLPLAWKANADIVLLVLDSEQWKGGRYRGWRADADSGVIELQIGADENERLGSEWGSFAGQRAIYAHGCHEIMHALYMFTGQPDMTHVSRDQYGSLDFARDNLIFSYQSQKMSFLWKGLSYAAKMLAPFVSKAPTVSQWAEAIKEFEGWFPGSVSQRHRNPGNLRWSPFEIGNDGYSHFKTYEDGWRALIHQLTIAITGRSKVYNPEMTLLQFFQKYAPSGDDNHPETYANFVAKKLGIKVDYQIKNIKI